MADLSLDDFIRKNNVKVRVKNPQQGRQSQKKTATNKIGLRQPMKNINAKKRLGTTVVTDARKRLGSKTVADARDKIIINKKSGAGDARNKIVQKQVQKGTFDARSLLQRQQRKTGPLENFTVRSNTGGSLSLKRTLSNPSAQGRPMVKVTNSGLMVTKPVHSAPVSLGSSYEQSVRKTRPYEGNVASAVPIIQIRNDRYREPGQQPPPRATQSSQYYSHPTSRQSSYPDYDATSYSYASSISSSRQRGYTDLDDPQYNAASIAVPAVPKVHITNIKPIEAPGRSMSYGAGDYTQVRAPPGAATVSQSAKQSVSKTVLQPAKLTQTGLKRRLQPQEVSGPLRLGKGGGPGIDLGPGDPSPNKKSKMAAIVDDPDVIDIDEGVELISPLQGFRVMVTNLFTGVTQDDIIELFGAVGPLKKAKLLKPGTAEVVYVSKDDALSAVQKYHSRELDGQPMYVKMTTPVAAIVKKAVGDHDPDITGEALRLYKKGSGMASLPEAPVEIPTIHRALFKAGPPGPNKSVKFTVKI